MTLTSPLCRAPVACAEPSRSRGQAPGPVFAALDVANMPRRLRPDVERLMAELLPESTWQVPVADPMEAQWCTRWSRDTFGVCSRQVISAPADALARLAAALGELAREHGFVAELRPVS